MGNCIFFFSQSEQCAICNHTASASASEYRVDSVKSPFENDSQHQQFSGKYLLVSFFFLWNCFQLKRYSQWLHLNLNTMFVIMEWNNEIMLWFIFIQIFCFCFIVWRKNKAFLDQGTMKMQVHENWIDVLFFLLVC